ncbi:hypothetical protein G6F68_020785 [Rhizopus microsporus]|nr:hypothetical protein G6F68_020785 [Rhizopus microsporus]
MAGLRAAQRPDDLSPHRHLPHGLGRRRRDRRALARERPDGAARRGRGGDAEDGLRQHAGRRHDGGRARRRNDPGGRRSGILSDRRIGEAREFLNKDSRVQRAQPIRQRLRCC